MPVLLILTTPESSYENEQNSAGQFYCRVIFKFPCIYNVNGAIIEMQTAYKLKFASTIYRGYMHKN